MAPISRLCLRRLELPLHRPYRLSYRTFETFEPYFVEVEDADGRVGFADAHISPGSSSETREGGWAFLCARLAESVGLEPQAAKAAALERFSESKVATTALVSALEVLEDNRLLEFPQPVTLPLLRPTLLLGAVLISVGYLQFFEESFVMTKGGPLDSTLSVAFYTYQQFGFGEYGLASAASYVLFLVIALVSLLQFRLLRSKD